MILMGGIDYKLAPLELREKLSFTDETIEQAYSRLKAMQDITGAVIVSTCNRTELYIVSETELDVFTLLCKLADADAESYPHYVLTGTAVMRHLSALAGGTLSQIWGEDQILAQVKSAIVTAREMGASCNVLEVLFREAVAAAKRIKSEIRLGVRENSIVHKALAAINAHGGEIKRVLVIGNGEIGRLTARTLAENGYSADMTLRTYRRGETVVPPGVRTIPYSERYEKLSDYDALVSATRSPHHTIDAQKLGSNKYPLLWLDLAVPRDIDTKIAELPGVTYFNVDTLGAGDAWEDREEKMCHAGEIIERYVSDFEKWLDYREKLDDDSCKSEYFPMFVSSRGKKALLVGGGKIAARRAGTLTRFEFDVAVVAREALDEISQMASRGQLELIRRSFVQSDLDGCFLVVAATDDRDLNKQIGELAAQRGIFASIADSREECGFLFPAIAVSGDIVAGLTSGGKSHSAVAQAAKRVREVL